MAGVVRQDGLEAEAVPGAGEGAGTVAVPRLRRRRGKLIGLLIAIALIGAGAATWWTWFDTYHLATVQQDVLYRDGNQSMRRFGNAIGKTKPKTVVMLVEDNEIAATEKPQFAQEIEFLKQQGIKVERIPVPLGGWPTSGDVQRFLDVVNRQENRPVLVHCAQGVRRTGMMVAAYQMSAQGMDKQKAKDAVLTFGHSERTVSDVKKFIDGYDPQSRTTPWYVTSETKE